MATKKAAASKRPSKPPKPIKLKKKPKPVPAHSDAGDPPVIFDDGGCTRIRQARKGAGGFLDGLLASPYRVTINNTYSRIRIHGIDFDDQDSKTTFTQADNISSIEIQTAAGSTLKVTFLNLGHSGQATFELLNGVRVTPVDDGRTHQRSYVGNDNGSISNIIINSGSNTWSAAYTAIHIKFQ